MMVTKYVTEHDKLDIGFFVAYLQIMKMCN